jgi:hypothetical protein
MECIDKFILLSRNIKKCKRVTRYSTETYDEVDTLAHALIDIEESLKQIINDDIPKLYLNELNEKEIDDIILDIGEEFRHLLYHIKDTKVYNYILKLYDY